MSVDAKLQEYIDHNARKSEWNPRVRVYRETDQAIPTGTSGAAISFSASRWDTADMWNVADPTKLYCRVPGHYIIQGAIRFAANATGYRQLQAVLNGTTVLDDDMNPANTAANGTTLRVNTNWVLAEGDYIELIATQNSGGDLAVKSASAYSPELSMYLK